MVNLIRKNMGKEWPLIRHWKQSPGFRARTKVGIIICLISGFIFFLLGICWQKYQDFQRKQEEKAALEATLQEAKAISSPKLKINLRPEHIFTQNYKLPRKLYTLRIQNLNKKSAPVFDFGIEFAFPHKVVEVKQKVSIPTSGISVGEMEHVEKRGDELRTVYKEQPIERPETKYFSLQIERAEVRGNLVNTHMVVFNCKKWPNKKALYTGKIVVDLSTKPEYFIKKPYLIGKYEGKYSYKIMDKEFSEPISGNIPSPNENSHW